MVTPNPHRIPPRTSGLRCCEDFTLFDDAWVAATEAGPDVRAELGELLTRARIEHRVWGEDYRCGSIAATQAQIGELKAEATVIREYQPSMMPSIVQTGRQVQIVLGQAALTVHFGSVETLIGQLDRLVILAGLTSVDLRVLPSVAPSPILPLGVFSIHDDETLWLETLMREVRSTDAEESTAHTAAFELARKAAAAGADAVALIQRVAAELRGWSSSSPSTAGARASEFD